MLILLAHIRQKKERKGMDRDTNKNTYSLRIKRRIIYIYIVTRDTAEYYS